MTDKQKIEIYEEFLHKINIFCITCNSDGIRKLVENADSWSYAHRVGECMSDEDREKLIEEKTKKLTQI